MLSISQVYFFSFLGLLVLSVLLYILRLKFLSDIFQKCWAGKDKDLLGVADLRGKNYSLTIDGPRDRYCFLTTWAITHIALYFILGVLFPNRFFETLVIGILFEFAEWIFLDCHDVLDILWNTLGFGLGVLFRFIFA